MTIQPSNPAEPARRVARAPMIAVGLGLATFWRAGMILGPGWASGVGRLPLRPACSGRT